MYRPVHNTVHDELELLTISRQVAEIEYWDAGSSRKIVTRIADLEIRGQAEFVVLDNGFRIRLDMLKSVNGRVVLDN